jgi:hypothetical protein
MDTLFETLYELLADAFHYQRMAALAVAQWIVRTVDHVCDDTPEKEVPVYIPLHPMTAEERERVKPRTDD